MRNLKLVFSALIGSVVMGATAASAATVVYSNDFESGSDANLTGGNIAGTQGYSAHGYGGSFYHNTTRNDATTLTLSNLAPHTEVTVTFDLAMIDSWDGAHATWGTDLFNISADGGLLLSELAVNSNSISRLGSMTSEIGNVFGQSQFADATYRITMTFAHTSSNLLLSMFGSTGTGTGVGFQGLLDENFAIDNILISTNAALSTPLPAAAWFMGAGIAAYASSRRKKA